MTWLAVHAPGLLFCLLAWLIITAALGGALLRGWYRRDRRASATTQQVMDSLRAEPIQDHRWDSA